MGYRSGAKRLFAAAAAALTIGVAGAGHAQPAADARTGTAVAPYCDRACMISITDQYLAALVKHDPSGLPLNRDVKFTENDVTLHLGTEGLWIGASEAPTTFKIYAVDLDTGQVGFYGVMKEWGRPLIIALRLKVVNGKITQIEQVLARNIRGDAALKNLVTPRPEFLEDVKPADREPRQIMVNIANSYFDAIENANGKLAPFADDCVRHENGGQTTYNKTPQPWPVPLGSKATDDAMAYIGTLSCSAQFDTHIMDFIKRLWPRREEVVDRQKGLVFTFPMFQQPGQRGPFKVYGVPGVTEMPLGKSASNLQAGELFKIEGGQIKSIEAMGAQLPYGTKSAWE